MNTLILLIPSTTEGHYLPKFADSKSVSQYFDTLSKLLGWIDEEEYELRYSKQSLDEALKLLPKEKSPQKLRTRILLNLQKHKAVSAKYISALPPVTVCRVQYQDIAVLPQIHDSSTSCMLYVGSDINASTLYDLKNTIGGDKPWHVIGNDIDGLHLWFVEHRSPKRVFDYAYAVRHSRNDKLVDGKKVSGYDHTPEETEHHLSHAVGIKGHTNIYYRENDANIIFYRSQNNKFVPTYHGNDTSTADHSEMAKIPPRIKEKIKRFHPAAI